MQQQQQQKDTRVDLSKLEATVKSLQTEVDQLKSQIVQLQKQQQEQSQRTVQAPLNLDLALLAAAASNGSGAGGSLALWQMALSTQTIANPSSKAHPEGAKDDAEIKVTTAAGLLEAVRDDKYFGQIPVPKVQSSASS
jgi:hypothetical protein